MFTWKSFTVCICFSAAFIASSVAEDKASQLIHHLLRDYNKLTVPGGHVNVNVSLNLVSLDFEGPDSVRWNVWMTYSWTDKRLRWNASEYDGIHELRLPASKIWTPDIVQYNGIKRAEELPVNTVIYSSGMVLHVPQLRLFSKCHSRFYSSIWFCNLLMGSWTYDASRLNVTFGQDNGMRLTDYVESVDLAIMEHNATRNEMKYECCPETYVFMNFTVKLNRRFFMQGVQFTFLVFIALLAPFVFLTKRRQKLRLILCVVIFLAFALGCLTFYLVSGVGGLLFFNSSFGILVLMFVCFIVHLLPRYSDGPPICVKQFLSKSESKQQDVAMKDETETERFCRETKKQQQQQQQQQANRVKCLILGPVVDAVCFGLSFVVFLVLLMKA